MDAPSNPRAAASRSGQRDSRSPSCDLLNRKVSTITYLPIISFVDWVSSRDFRAEVVGAMISIAEQLTPLAILNTSTLECDETCSLELSEQMLELQRKMAGEKLDKTLRICAERYIAGGAHLKRVSCGARALLGDLEVCLSKKRWQHIRTQVVRNAFRSDLYFLPADGNTDIELSPITKHSVVLFRYPLTAPVSVLDAAQSIALSDWNEAVAKLAVEEPMANAFAGPRPLKCLRLQNRFLADLLTKFVSLYSRLGSPDFTRETVETLSNELGALE